MGAPSKPSKDQEPLIDFKDPDSAALILDDIRDTWSLFDGPVNIQLLIAPGKGGKPDFWDKVARLRAEFLRTELMRRGLPEKMLVASGQTAVKGTDPCLKVRLLMD